MAHSKQCSLILNFDAFKVPNCHLHWAYDP